MLPVYRACLSRTSKADIAPGPLLAAIVVSCACDQGSMARVWVEEVASHRDSPNCGNPYGTDAGGSHFRSMASTSEWTGQPPRRREPS